MEGGGSVFYLNGANEYGDTLIGPNVAIVLLDGTLGIGNTAFDPTPSNPFLPMFPALVFANSADYNYGGTITGNGQIEVAPFDPAITVTLSGSNTSGNNFTGTVTVLNGRLNIDGNFGDIDNLSAELIVAACSCFPEDAILGGSGTFFGNVTITDGTLSVGNSPGTLTIAGNLTLGAGTILNYEFGQPGVVGANVNDFVTVGGNLTLDGTLNVIDFGPSYGPGYYALFRYGGTLTDNGLAIGSIDGGLSTSLLFNIPGQINLLLGPQVIQYWDGADTTGVASGSGALNGDGAAGTWNAGNTNWTGASGFGVNDQWRSTVAVFAGAAGGTVTVDGVQTFQELRFQTDNYLLRPADGAARLATTGGFSVVDVSTGITADIGVVIEGAAGLTKTGSGTLLLSANNIYAGPTTVSAGTLRMGASFALPTTTALTVSAGATFDLNSFQTEVGSLAGAGAVTLGTSTTLNFGSNNSSTSFSGNITGDGTVAKAGTGTFTLSGGINLSGAGFTQFLVTAGTVDVTSAGSISANLIQNLATLNNAGTLTGDVLNLGAMTNSGTIAGNTQSLVTFDNSGTMGPLQVLGGSAINSGTINGFVSNLVAFTSTGIVNGELNNDGTAALQGQLNGTLANRGTVTLTGITTGIVNYDGGSSATFDLAGFSTTIGSLSGAGFVQLGSATLTAGGNNSVTTFAGVISGSGGLTKVGIGTLTLSGANTYTGLTTVSAGTLEIAFGGSLAGEVNNAANFINGGTVSGFVDNSGTLENSGTFAAGARNLGVGAVFTTTGIVNADVSGLALTNGGTVNASGQINGAVSSIGIFSVTGALTGITLFNQSVGASLNLQGNDLAVGGLGGTGTVDLGGATLTVGVGNLDFDLRRRDQQRRRRADQGRHRHLHAQRSEYLYRPDQRRCRNASGRRQRRHRRAGDEQRHAREFRDHQRRCRQQRHLYPGRRAQWSPRQHRQRLNPRPAQQRGQQ